MHKRGCEVLEQSIKLWMVPLTRTRTVFSWVGIPEVGHCAVDRGATGKTKIIT